MVIFFPFFGLIMLYIAYYHTREWFYFGRTLLRMDPFPGVIGGYVGGEVTWSRQDKNKHYRITLSCVYHYETKEYDPFSNGPSKYKTVRHEKIIWQDELDAYEIATEEGAMLKFRFKVPMDLPETEDVSDSYHNWRLNVKSQGKGLLLDRDFQLPVYAIDRIINASQ